MKKSVCFFLLVLAGAPFVGAQESLFQSSDGNTAVFLSSSTSGKTAEDRALAGPGAQSSTAGVALYNYSASKAEFGYLYQKSGMKPLGFGFSVAGTLKQGAVSIVHADASAPGVSLQGTVTKNITPGIDASKVKESGTFVCHVCSEWLVFQAKYSTSQFYTVPTSTAPFPTPTKQTFNGAQGVAGYNALLKTSNADWLFGATVGVGLLNNTDSLKSAQYTSNQVTTTGGTQEIIGQGSQTLYVGNYKTFAGVPINIDAIVFPGALSGMVGFDLFVRSDIASADQFANPGIGLFISKMGQPARPVGGITASYKNGKGEVSLVAGWSF